MLKIIALSAEVPKVVITERNEKNGNFTSYKKLLKNYLWDRDFTLSWLKDEGLIPRSRIYTVCGSEMN